VSRAILDTSVFIAQESERPLAPFPPGRATAVSVVTVAELEIGVLAAADASVRARRLRTLRRAEESKPLPIDRGVASRFAELVVAARAAGRGRLAIQDAWIAATALHHDAELWTQDDDFGGVAGLRVVRI
jgi:predicted nucleic acid-binding protein